MSSIQWKEYPGTPAEFQQSLMWVFTWREYVYSKQHKCESNISKVIIKMNFHFISKRFCNSKHSTFILTHLCSVHSYFYYYTNPAKYQMHIKCIKVGDSQMSAFLITKEKDHSFPHKCYNNILIPEHLYTQNLLYFYGILFLVS